MWINKNSHIKYIIHLRSTFNNIKMSICDRIKCSRIYCLYQDELDKWLETNRKNPVPLTAEEENAAILAGNKRKPKPLNW